MTVCFVFLNGAATVLAHHSFAAEYDKNKPIKFTGIVTKVEWMNPHIYYYVDVKDGVGKVTNYAVEGGTPNNLRRQGWGKDSLKTGDMVTVEGFMAKNGSNNVNGRNVTLPDGKRLFAGSDDGGPGR
jgi:DNA/RNA endonuclease YhcR with UshA esterase domain